MKKEYTKPELNITEYIIDTNITADPISMGIAIGNENDANATWDEIWGTV